MRQTDGQTDRQTDTSLHLSRIRQGKERPEESWFFGFFLAGFGRLPGRRPRRQPGSLPKKVGTPIPGVNLG